MNPTQCYVVYAKRTPMGKLQGSLSHLRVDDMMAQVLMDLKAQLTFDPLLIDDVIIGCANQAGEDNRNLARMSAVLAGLPFEVPAVTTNRLCGSSLSALMEGFARITAGLDDCLVVGGAESMTRAPYALSKGTTPFGRDGQLFDTTFGWRFTNPKMEKIFPLLGMGQTAEEIAKEYKISRERQDQFALGSHQKAVRAWEKQAFQEEIVPVQIEMKKSSIVVDQDECPRSDTTLEKLASLRPVFLNNGSVTAGNSSPMNDGASAMMIVSESFLIQHKLTPLVRMTGAATRGVHPSVMGIGPVAATQKLCDKLQMKVQDFDVIELNEAFAAQALACIDLLKIDADKINLNGGAIALGHPLGCSGSRIATTLIHQMKNNPQFKKGLASMCIGVGQGISASFERV
jgi:acetyl-CoA acyltransferase